MTDSNPQPKIGEGSSSDGAASAQSGGSIIGRVIGGDFEIRREIGRGGMGTVYLAWQHSLQRMVALKVLANTLGLTGNAVVRFRREAQAAAKLHHANIVPIHAQGEDNGIYYYAMDYIEGQDLNEIINQRRGRRRAGGLDLTETKLILGSGSRADGSSAAQAEAPLSAPASGLGDKPSRTAIPAVCKSTMQQFDKIAEHIAAAAEALAYAHGEGVIHRDIKPHNFILGKDDRMYITDFGLARVLEQPGVTMTGEFVGSPLYMSPEQIRGGSAGVDHRTDVYSLGATMYEWLTLKAPYPGETREQVISMIISSDAPVPRWIDPNIPVDLETVCLKAMEKDRAHRYQTAGEMAQDLRRYLLRDSIRARREGVISRGRKFIARNRVPVFVAAAVVIISGVAGIALTLQQRSFENVRDQQSQKLAAVQDVRQQLQDHVDDLEAKQRRLVEMIEPGKIDAVEIVGEIVSWLDQAKAEVLERPEVEGSGDESAGVRSVPAGGEGAPTVERPPTLTDQDRELIALLTAGFAGRLREAEAERTSIPISGIANSAEADRYYRDALEASDGDAALELVNDALRNDPGHFDAIHLRAIIYAQQLDFARLIDDGDFMVLLRPDSPAGYVMHGIGMLSMGQLADSIEDFDRGLEIDPDNSHVLIMRGMARLFVGGFTSSFEDLERAVGIDPDNAAGFVARGAVHARRGNFVQAILDLDKAIKLRPSSAAAQLERKYIGERIERELERYTTIINDQPGNAIALEKRGDAYIMLGNWELATADYRRALPLSESVPASLVAKTLFAGRELDRRRSEGQSSGPGGQPRDGGGTGEQRETIPDWFRAIIIP